ncbi:MAG: sulfotransferase [Proteobacteria bacterium]|nr:sulfotransferase [Pseudomonadota bacterium]
MTETSDRHWNRAQRYLAEGNLDAARVKLESFLQHNPRHARAQLLLADIAWEDDRVRESAVHALAAAALVADEPEAIVDTVAALIRAGETQAAARCLDSPSSAGVRSVQALVQMAEHRYLLNQTAQSLALYDRAKSLGADGPDFRFRRGVQLIFNGRIDEAEGEFRETVRRDPTYGRAWQELARLRKRSATDNHLAGMASALQRVAPGSYEHASIEFARYKELEDLGQMDAAWAALAHGNALMYARHRHDPAKTRVLFENLTRACDARFLRPVEAVHAGPQPIFIIGMPRSGTTVLDRLLGNHSQVQSVGELDDFAFQLRWTANHRVTLDATIIERLPQLDFALLGRRYLEQTQWRAAGRPFYTDKLPRNWMLAGLIAKALPQARILHLVRDPMDVCFSNFRALFADAFAHIYDLDALASHYRIYRHTLAHWQAAMPGRILDVAYADLVADPDATLRHVLDFCGLPWEAGCADLTRNRSAVSTLSAVQVREPIHKRFVDSWRRYEAQLAPLARALALPD